MHLARPVRVLISAVADCPSVVGWIKPVVLLPAATVLGLTPQQLEAVLAHELAHILRYDYLLNMLQTVVETLLFYHPAVWWASARIRQERELCCDDLAVDSCGDALCYARALTRLERLRVTTPRLALGSAGGPLLYRIQRLAGDTGWQRGPSKLPGILALSLGLVCFALNMQWARGQQPDAPAPEPAALANGMPDDPGVRVVEATLDADGAVGDARVLSGPPELRKAALQSVLQWHFTHDAAGSTRQVGFAFTLPAEGDAEARALAEAQREQTRVQALVQKQLAESMAEQARNLQRPTGDAPKLQAEGILLSADPPQSQRSAQAKELEHQLQVLQNQAAALAANNSVAAQMAAIEKRLADLRAGSRDFSGAAMFAGRRLKTIRIQGLTNASRDELLAKLPVHVGDTLAEDSMEKVNAAVKQFDSDLGLWMLTTRDGQVEIRIFTPGSSDSLEQRQ